MCDGLRVVPAPAQTLGQFGELLGGFLGQDLAGLRGFQSLGVGEAITQFVAPGGVVQVFKGHFRVEIYTFGKFCRPERRRKRVTREAIMPMIEKPCPDRKQGMAIPRPHQRGIAGLKVGDRAGILSTWGLRATTAPQGIGVPIILCPEVEMLSKPASSIGRMGSGAFRRKGITMAFSAPSTWI